VRSSGRAESARVGVRVRVRVRVRATCGRYAAVADATAAASMSGPSLRHAPNGMGWGGVELGLGCG